MCIWRGLEPAVVPVSVSVFLRASFDGYIKGLQIQMCVERWLRVMRLMVGVQEGPRASLGSSFVKF